MLMHTTTSLAVKLQTQTGPYAMSYLHIQRPVLKSHEKYFAFAVLFAVS
jgi:MarR-like DNA-binding transcriptional regulator SgrR of sgrS sRNA